MTEFNGFLQEVTRILLPVVLTALSILAGYAMIYLKDQQKKLKKRVTPEEYDVGIRILKGLVMVAEQKFNTAIEKREFVQNEAVGAIPWRASQLDKLIDSVVHEMGEGPLSERKQQEKIELSKFIKVGRPIPGLVVFIGKDNPLEITMDTRPKLRPATENDKIQVIIKGDRPSKAVSIPTDEITLVDKDNWVYEINISQELLSRHNWFNWSTKYELEVAIVTGQRIISEAFSASLTIFDEEK